MANRYAIVLLMITDSTPSEQDEFEEVPVLERAAYLEHRKLLIELSIAQINAFDKALLFLATGALGLSIVFVSTFLQGKKPVEINVLATAWAFYVLCIIANLISYKTGWKSSDYERDLLDHRYFNNDWETPSKTRYRNATVCLNYAGLLLFIFATFFLFYFAYANLIGV